MRTVEVDRHGKVVRELKDAYKRPVPGHDIQLTIDIDVQRTTETRLAANLESHRGELAPDGRAIITAPAGSAVAASHPAFANDPAVEIWRQEFADLVCA